MQPPTMTSPETDLFDVSLSLSISPHEADAGAELALTAVAECPEEYDLSGDPVVFLDASGNEIGSAPLEALEGNEFSAEITLTAPTELGEYAYSAVLAPAEGEGFAHAGASAEASCGVKAHDLRLNAWDIPSAIVAGDTFSFHIGVKCSGSCKLGRRAFDVRDENGAIVASGKLRDAVWPGTSALHYAEVQATAPQDIGTRNWTVEFAGSHRGIAHSPGSLSILVRTVAAPDNEITIEAVSRETGAPLEGVNLIMHPYRATTGQDGVARMKVTADHYLLRASGRKRLPYQDHLDATKPIKIRLLLAIEQPKNDHAPPPIPQEPSIAEVLQ